MLEAPLATLLDVGLTLALDKGRDLRTDTEIGVRDFGVALRRLRHLSTRLDGPASAFDIGVSVKQTADHTGQLRLSVRRPRRNTVRVLLMLDRLLTAVHQAGHFLDLRTRFFHNCV